MDNLKVPHRRTRHAVELAATVKRDSGRSVPCTISDLSLDGCSLSGFFRIGERVEVTLPSIGMLQAEIRWATLGRAGARFISRVARAA